MAFKMKGSSLYGKINLNRGGQANRPDGRAKSSSFQKTGGFITDVDELTGKKTTRRATYDDTRKAEKAGKETTYTNREFNKRMDEDISNAKKGISEDGTPIGVVNSKTGKEANDIIVKSKTNTKNQVNKYTRENKQTKEQIAERKLDRAEQDRIEREAVKAKKEKKGDKSNTKPLTAEQRRILALNDAKTTSKVDPNKPGTAGSTYHVGKSNKKRDEEVKKPGATMKKSPMEKGGDGCGGNFKVNKPGTVVSRALKRAGGSVKRGLDNVVDNIKKGNKKRKKKRNTVKAPKNTGGGGHIVRSSTSYN